MNQGKRKQIIKFARLIEDMGFTSYQACSLCASQGRRCIVLDEQNKTRCSECVRQKKRKCNAIKVAALPTEVEIDSLDRQIEKLQAEEEEALAKILNLRTRQRQVKKQKLELARRGLQSLDEVDALDSLVGREHWQDENSVPIFDDSWAFDPVEDKGTPSETPRVSAGN